MMYHQIRVTIIATFAVVLSTLTSTPRFCLFECEKACCIVLSEWHVKKNRQVL